VISRLERRPDLSVLTDRIVAALDAEVTVTSTP
jgi:hypothetical protein